MFLKVPQYLSLLKHKSNKLVQLATKPSANMQHKIVHHL